MRTIFRTPVVAGFLAVYLNSTSAFLSSSPQHYMRSSCYSVDSKIVILFAGKKKKQKQKKQSKTRSSSSTGGGGGFGRTSAGTESKTTTKKAQQTTSKSKSNPPILQRSATEVAKLNTFHIINQIYQQQEEGQKLSNGPTKETADEIARLTAAYTDHFHQQQELVKERQLVRVSESPLIFTIDDFIDPEACNRVQNDASGCFNLLFPETVSDQLFSGQESEMDGLLFNTASSLQHTTEEAYPDGLHMDTNNQCMFRHVTCLLYLNDVPEECGGATVFPLARCLPDDPAFAASQRLLSHRISHTRNSREIGPLGLQDDVDLIESRVGTNFPQNPNTNTAIRIQPKAGRLLIFFSRDSNGKEDPRAWHAGERIFRGSGGSVTEKRILTLFKEVDYAGNHPIRAASTFQAYLAPQIEGQRKWLQAKAQLQRALLTL